MEKIVSQIIAVMEEQLKTKPRILVAIDGSCTSGKSTLAQMLVRELKGNLFRLDAPFA